MNPGADRENTTVMAAVSTSSAKLHPIIFFEGAHMYRRPGDRTLQRMTQTIHCFMLTSPAGWTVLHFTNGLKNGRKKHGATTTKVNWNRDFKYMTGTFHMFGMVQSSLLKSKSYQ